MAADDLRQWLLRSRGRGLLNHLDRAKSFFEGMKLLALDLKAYGNAAALLAIHTSISLTDAVLIAVDGTRSIAEDHRVAVRQLRRLCSAFKFDDRGVKHVDWLVQGEPGEPSRVHHVTYARHRVSQCDHRFALG